MQKNKRTLHLFTSEYPYGNKSETFIETEIIYLSKHFDNIILYPKTTQTIIRETPSNVSVNNFRSEFDYSKKSKLFIALKYFSTFCEILTSEVYNKKKIKGLKFLIDYLLIQLIEFRSFKHVKFNKGDVFYDYWFSNATLMLAIAKRKHIINHFFARAHAFDIYDESWGEYGLPYRNSKIKEVAKVFVISDYGLKYFKAKIKPNYTDKLELSRLGVHCYPQIQTIKNFNNKIIVSCSSVSKRKGVDKIIDVLKRIELPLHWIHFGDGTEFNKTKAKISDLPNNITAELKGHISNKEIISFYQNYKVDLFLTLSESEGIPVSIMEAISFGIQIAAYPVGGIPEIVIPNKTGYLLKDNNTEYLEIIRALNYPIPKNTIKEFYSCNFNAEKNYSEFVKKLC